MPPEYAKEEEVDSEVLGGESCLRRHHHWRGLHSGNHYHDDITISISSSIFANIFSFFFPQSLFPFIVELQVYTYASKSKIC